MADAPPPPAQNAPDKNAPPTDASQGGASVDPDMVMDVQSAALQLAIQAGMSVDGLSEITYTFDEQGNVGVKAQSASGAFNQTFPGDAVMAAIGQEPADGDPQGE